MNLPASSCFRPARPSPSTSKSSCTDFSPSSPRERAHKIVVLATARLGEITAAMPKVPAKVSGKAGGKGTSDREVPSKRETLAAEGVSEKRAAEAEKLAALKATGDLDRALDALKTGARVGALVSLAKMSAPDRRKVIDKMSDSGNAKKAIAEVKDEAKQALDVVRTEDGDVAVPFRELCDAVGVSFAAQTVKVNGAPWASVIMMITQLHGDTQTREIACLHRRSIPLWAATIHASKVDPSVRAKLVAYQRECADVLADHFLGKRGSASGPVDHAALAKALAPMMAAGCLIR